MCPFCTRKPGSMILVCAKCENSIWRQQVTYEAEAKFICAFVSQLYINKWSTIVNRCRFLSFLDNDSKLNSFLPTGHRFEYNSIVT